jgi:hypothetical protein
MSTHIAFLLGVETESRTALAKALAAHPAVQVAEDAHVLTALAHLGYYDKVHKAPYDHILAAEAQRLFVDRLPRKEADYVEACRAHCDTLYGRALEGSGKSLLLDATAQYLDIQPFLRRLYPEAPCVVVTRHPLVLLARIGARAAHRAVETAAAMLRNEDTPVLRIRAEDFAAEPSAQADAACSCLEVGFDGGVAEAAQVAAKGITPVESLAKEWRFSEHLAEAQRFVRRLAPEDLYEYGYSVEELWLPFDAPEAILPRVAPARIIAVQRRALNRMRRRVQGSGAANRLVRKLRLACDVLLRQ